MKTKNLLLLVTSILLTSCSWFSGKDIDKKGDVLWKNEIRGNDLIGNEGLGYPVYKNTVVFHSTPKPDDDDSYSVIYGLDVRNGEKIWQLSNEDFHPKKQLSLHTLAYQYKNIMVGTDEAYKRPENEKYVYAIEIENGKILWIKQVEGDWLQYGRIIKGKGKYAYLDSQKSAHEFSLIKIEIDDGGYSVVLQFNHNDLPKGIDLDVLSFYDMSEVYSDSAGKEYIALSFSSYDYEVNPDKSYMTLCVFNITESKIAYIKYINTEEFSRDEWDTFYGRVVYHNGKIFIGKSRRFYCVDAFEDKEVYWHYATGEYGNDNAMQVLAYNNIAIGYTIENIYGFNIDTGELLYKEPAGGSPSASIIDGVIYQRDKSDLQMRDPRTGKELKRIATPAHEQAFASAPPNGADGRIFLHSYTHAYCVRAYGK